MSKNVRVALILLLTVAVSIFMVACGGGTGSTTTTSAPTAASTPASSGGAYTFQCVTGKLNTGGSTALKPLVDALAQTYQGKCSGASIPAAAPSGSKTGLANSESGAYDIGNSDLFADPTTQADLVDHQVAVVVFTLVLNTKVTGVTNLTTDQIKAIYTGVDTNWSQVGGNSLPITVVSRPASSGTRQTFRNYILGTAEKPAKQSALTQDTTSLVLQTVEQTDGAIGYVALGNAKQEGSKVTIANIDGQSPTPTAVESNSYKFWNIEHMYTKGQASGIAQAFIEYVAKSDDAKTAATKLAYININDMSQTAISAHPAPTPTK